MILSEAQLVRKGLLTNLCFFKFENGIISIFKYANFIILLFFFTSCKEIKNVYDVQLDDYNCVQFEISQYKSRLSDNNIGPRFPYIPVNNLISGLSSGSSIGLFYHGDSDLFSKIGYCAPSNDQFGNFYIGHTSDDSCAPLKKLNYTGSVTLNKGVHPYNYLMFCRDTTYNHKKFCNLVIDYSIFTASLQFEKEKALYADEYVKQVREIVDYSVVLRDRCDQR